MFIIPFDDGWIVMFRESWMMKAFLLGLFKCRLVDTENSTTGMAVCSSVWCANLPRAVGLDAGGDIRHFLMPLSSLASWSFRWRRNRAFRIGLWWCFGYIDVILQNCVSPLDDTMLFWLDTPSFATMVIENLAHLVTVGIVHVVYYECSLVTMKSTIPLSHQKWRESWLESRWWRSVWSTVLFSLLVFNGHLRAVRGTVLWPF